MGFHNVDQNILTRYLHERRVTYMVSLPISNIFSPDAEAKLKQFIEALGGIIMAQSSQNFVGQKEVPDAS